MSILLCAVCAVPYHKCPVCLSVHFPVVCLTFPLLPASADQWQSRHVGTGPRHIRCRAVSFRYLPEDRLLCASFSPLFGEPKPTRYVRDWNHAGAVQLLADPCGNLLHKNQLVLFLISSYTHPILPLTHPLIRRPHTPLSTGLKMDITVNKAQAALNHTKTNAHNDIQAAYQMHASWLQQAIQVRRTEAQRFPFQVCGDAPLSPSLSLSLNREAQPPAVSSCRTR